MKYVTKGEMKSGEGGKLFVCEKNWELEKLKVRKLGKRKWEIKY